MSARLVPALLCLAGCAPELGADAWLVDRVRLLAVRAEPAEVPPGAVAVYSAFLASPDGSDASSTLSWSLCTAPKPISENDTVASACVLDPDALQPLGEGTTVSVTMPEDACQRFGPDPPPQGAGEAPLRPRDADITGGYYQPLRVDDGTGTSFPLQRITCSLAGASAKVAAEFRARYRANQNPELAGLSAYDAAGDPLALDALPADTEITLRASWPAVSAETYPVYDLATRTLLDRRESLRVSWFAAVGSLALDHSGRTATEIETFAENTWRTPVAGPVRLWVVLRDDRGGVAFLRADGNVR